MQDTLLRLDRTLGQFFDALDRQVGRNSYVVGLSADHGVSPIPEQRKSQGGDAGRVMAPEIRKVAEAAMVAAHGPGPHVASVESTICFFTTATRSDGREIRGWQRSRPLRPCRRCQAFCG